MHIYAYIDRYLLWISMRRRKKYFAENLTFNSDSGTIQLQRKNIWENWYERRAR